MSRDQLLPFAAGPDRQHVWEAPRAATLVELLAPASLAPDLVALLFTDHGSAAESVTWGALQDRAQGRAAELAAAGVGPGDRVVLMLPTLPAFFECFFGTLLLGGVPVPVAPPHSLRREKVDTLFEAIVRIARDCDAAVIVGLDRPLGLLADYLRDSESALRLVSASCPAPAHSVQRHPRPDPSELALLQYTSGSTSHPKGVELTHGNIIANAAAIVGALAHPGSSGVFWLPLHHDMGLIGGALSALYSRSPVVLMPPQAFAKAPARWLQCISDVRATVTAAPNFAFAHCTRAAAEEDLAGVDLGSLEVALNGAEPIDAGTISRFEARFAAQGLRPGTVRPVYGLAESALAVTFGDPGPARIDIVDADPLERKGRARPADGGRTRTFVSVGRAIATQEIRVVDSSDRDRGQRRIGEIVVRGPSIMRGYHRQPASSADALRGGWLHTGDLGYLADGRLYVTGRSKDLIIRLGRNYHAQDIEQAVSGTAGVWQGSVAAFGLDTDHATTLVVVAETRLREPVELAELQLRIRERCQEHFDTGPDDVWIVGPGEIPRTTSGKVKRQLCRRQYERARDAEPAT